MVHLVGSQSKHNAIPASQENRHGQLQSLASAENER